MNLDLDKIEADAKAALAVDPDAETTLRLVAYIRELEALLYPIKKGSK